MYTEVHTPAGATLRLSGVEAQCFPIAKITCSILLEQSAQIARILLCFTNTCFVILCFAPAILSISCGFSLLAFSNHMIWLKAKVEE